MRELRQQAPARQAHHHAAGILVRRGHEDELGRGLRCGGRLHALRVHRHRLDLQARGAKHAARAPVAGVFHPHHIVRIGEQAGAQIDGLVAALRHHDLLGRAVDAARERQVLRQRALERRAAVPRAIAQLFLAGGFPDLRDQALPCRARELPDIRNAQHERANLPVRCAGAIEQLAGSGRQARCLA